MFEDVVHAILSRADEGTTVVSHTLIKFSIGGRYIEARYYGLDDDSMEVVASWLNPNRLCLGSVHRKLKASETIQQFVDSVLDELLEVPDYVHATFYGKSALKIMRKYVHGLIQNDGDLDEADLIRRLRPAHSLVRVVLYDADCLYVL